MAKVEELMALMVEEINRYESLVKKMEKLQQQKIEIEVSLLENILKKQEVKMQDHRKSLDYYQNKIQKLLDTANVYPKWSVIIFLTSILLNFGLLLIILLESGIE